MLAIISTRQLILLIFTLYAYSALAIPQYRTDSARPRLEAPAAKIPETPQQESEFAEISHANCFLLNENQTLNTDSTYVIEKSAPHARTVPIDEDSVIISIDRLNTGITTLHPLTEKEDLVELKMSQNGFAIERDQQSNIIGARIEYLAYFVDAPNENAILQRLIYSKTPQDFAIFLQEYLKLILKNSSNEEIEKTATQLIENANKALAAININSKVNSILKSHNSTFLCASQVDIIEGEDALEKFFNEKEEELNDFAKQRIHK